MTASLWSDERADIVRHLRARAADHVPEVALDLYFAARDIECGEHLLEQERGARVDRSPEAERNAAVAWLRRQAAREESLMSKSGDFLLDAATAIANGRHEVSHG